MDSTDTPRYEALRATLEAERRAWAKERRKMIATIARLRLKLWKLQRGESA